MISQKPLLIYDGDCNFCRHWIGRWKGITGDRVEYRPSQECAVEHPGISEEDFATAVQWVGADGRRESGAPAVFSALATAQFSGRLLLTLYRTVPPFAWAADFGYGVVARNRLLFSRLTRFVFGDEDRRPALPLLLVLPGVAFVVFLVAKNYPFGQYPHRRRSR